VAEGHMTVGSGALFKFPEFFGGTTYSFLVKKVITVDPLCKFFRAMNSLNSWGKT